MFVNGLSTVLKPIVLSEHRLCETKRGQNWAKTCFLTTTSSPALIENKKRILTESWKQGLCKYDILKFLRLLTNEYIIG